ncbi:speckle-type POZ protein-like B [Aphidius gifuensis]|uniref:speckle-type POZ protein-like B n=1 Tax=Aphidius gifuensis TaxID=684658 RepID=UPI001CDD0895|nr:speckle-type POZ protein-like B [Aphidius gifuensis]
MSVHARPATQSSIKHIMAKQEYVTDNMETCEFTYEWTIKNFIQYISGTIESSNFSSHFSDFNDVWILKIDPNKDLGTSGYQMKYMSVQLKLQSFNSTSRLFTKCKILIDPDIVKDEEYEFDKFPKESSWINCISRTDLSKYSGKYLQNDELKISCTMTISRERKNNSPVMSTFIPKPELNIDLKKLLITEQSADVTVNVGQKSFRVIKGILAARSPVFDAMFDHKQFKENKESEVIIEDIEEDVFEEFLHYIYTEETENVNKIPMELLAVAEKYQVDRLKKICEEIICGTINSDNVSSMLIFSDKYNVEKLKKKCLEFIKTNLQAVLSKEAYRDLKKKHPGVFLSVLEAIADVN